MIIFKEMFVSNLNILRTICRGAKLSRINQSNFYSITSSLKSVYDNDGKTTVTMLNQEPGLGIMIDSFSQAGFRLNNGMHVIGPMIIFPKTVLSWNIEGDHEISEKSLVLFSILEPKPDIVIIGYGNTTINRPKFDRIVMTMRSRRKRLNVEVLPTEKATSTYNFIAAEGRFVAAALIPPLEISYYDNDLASSKLKIKNLYED